MSQRKVAFLVSHSSPGGAQEIMANLAAGFAARGADAALVALYPTDRGERTAGLAWQYIVPRRPSNPLQAAGLLRALVAWFRRERPDTVFTALPAANALAALAARLAGQRDRVIISHHSPVETHNPLINRLDGVTGSLKSVRRVVSVSDTVAASLDAKPAAYRAKRATVHNALPPELEREIERLAASHEPRVARARRVVATGRLAAQKNYPQLIRAAAHLPDVAIDIVGNGPDEEALRALATSLGVEGRVAFRGFHPRAQALALLAEGDVFAQVSLFEGHSLALVEAAKLGLPLIVSDVPVQIEGITAADGTRCALVVPLNDDRALAAAIRLLLDDPAAYRDGALKARKLAQEATYEKMMDAYERLETGVRDGASRGD